MGRIAAKERFLPVLRLAAARASFPRSPFRLRMGRPTLEDSAGILHYEDVDGAIARMRSCLRDAIAEFGGQAAEGSDRSNGKPLPGGDSGEMPSHLPDIIHSTILRWRSEPSDRARAREIFDRVAQSWEPIDITVHRCCAVFEEVPYMHMPSPGGLVWWSHVAVPDSMPNAGTEALISSEVAIQQIQDLTDWRLELEPLPHLVFRFSASDSRSAMVFLSNVGNIALEVGCYPDISFGKNCEVSLTLINEALGGVTERDIQFVQALNNHAVA